MTLGCNHTIHKSQSHFGWDNGITPRLMVATGDTVEFKTVDSSGGQLTAASTVADIARLDFGKVNPVSGPIYVHDAEPGDAIKVTVLGYAASGWGWTASIPGFGLLADQFKDPALHVWRYEKGLGTPAAFGPGGRVPLRPFCGTIGLAPAEPGHHSVLPPRRVGGNMDIRDMAEGTELWLPVEVAGGLLSVGDTHAAQGDGEICGTAIESQMDIALKFELVKQANFAFPRFFVPNRAADPRGRAGWDATTGIGPDLMTGARDAVQGMIDLLCRRHNLSAVDAYMLCSVAGDLKISEIVDQPNWVVSFYFPRAVFE
ncbi:MAG: acetamidase/formamidase family protein [Dongiaceae bacterium]